ncbi:metalloregulator ArsR/SmtB family transcription factor [Stappia sp. GBMRC 2046]|uniref:Metalloregulator ArsR/SmtB family transcription factor n=1 Tax=Stappia sediminis TaxID=2692190 RepID=A0A7X3LW32_9HYPH|nr:metalloregulator ArsR/SmtB family transcription factor [Stappia sediminis]MXN66142.1 metalloregulator ArsR/SmtB family transcription factor [Stappia sediminis]
MTLDDAAARLEALGNPTRLNIYRTLVRAGEGGLSVSALRERVGGALSTLSHHLQKLVLVGLVIQERQGTTLICRANYDQMHGLVDYLTKECCADETDARQGDAA